MRKLLMALTIMFAMAGLVIAADTVTVLSYDKEKKELKYKDADDKEHTVKISKDAKFITTDRKGENAKDSDYEAFEKRASGKGGKGGNKMDITVKNDMITEVKWKMGKKN